MLVLVLVLVLMVGVGVVVKMMIMTTTTLYYRRAYHARYGFGANRSGNNPRDDRECLLYLGCREFGTRET